jgi:hypothetical protein
VVHLLLAQEIVVHKCTRAPADGLNPDARCTAVDETRQQVEMRSTFSCCEICQTIDS